MSASRPPAPRAFIAGANPRRVVPGSGLGEADPKGAGYDESVMAAGSVLDVGCGTGSMLHRARDRGHAGRLVDLEPDRAALARARRRTDVEWWRALRRTPGGAVNSS